MPVVVIDGASTNPDDYAYEISGNIYYADPVNGSDANPGTQSQPFQTIHYALSQVSGGDGLLLYGGNYGDVAWGRTGDAAWTQQPIAVVFTDWVTVKAVDGEDVIFDSLSLGTWNAPGTNTPMPFSTIGNSDLRMRFDGIQILDGIEIRGSRYVDIRNSTVSLAGDIQDRINDSGISVYNGQHVMLYHNEITHCGVGIQGMTTDFIVARNDIHHNTHDGLSMLGGSNWLVEGNTFRELDDGVDDTVSWGKHTDGTQLYFVNAPDPKWARLASDFTFRGNVFYHIESMAAMLGDSGLGRIERFTWENNVFGPMNGRMFIMAADVHDYFIFRNNSVIYAPNDSWTSMWGRTLGAAGYPLRDRYFNVQIWYGPAADNPHQANYQVYNNIFTSATPSYQEFGLVSNNLYIDTVNETMANAEIRTTQPPYTTITGNQR
ncbi:MAG: right-handed parallel beta-helix repeat-containing protein [Candidatus Thiodiazotropha sp.]